MFCATVMEGTRLVSWNTMAIPSLRASKGVLIGLFLAAIEHLAGSGLDDARHDLCQGGFACAILAEQGVDFALFKGEIHIA